MAGLLPTRHAFHAMMLLYSSRQGMLREVEEVQLRMEGYGYLPDVHTFSLVFWAIAANGDVQAIKRWVQRMQRAGVQPDLQVLQEWAWGAGPSPMSGPPEGRWQFQF